MTLVSRSLAQAFVNDPFYRAVTVEAAGDEVRRQEILCSYFQLAIEEGCAIGEVGYAGIDGAAVWLTNRVSHIEVAKYGSIRNSQLASLLGPRGYTNYSKICASMADRVPDDLSLAWYLSILGVQPGARGNGVAYALVKRTLDRADDFRAACFLETFNPLSLRFYERLGFQVAIDCFEEVTAHPYWIMVRPAAGPPGGKAGSSR